MENNNEVTKKGEMEIGFKKIRLRDLRKRFVPEEEISICADEYLSSGGMTPEEMLIVAQEELLA